MNSRIFRPKYEFRYYISIICILIVLPFFWFIEINAPMKNPLFTVIVIVVTLALPLLALRWFREIIFYDNIQTLVVKFWLLPQKEISYSSILEVSNFFIKAGKLKIYFHTMKNADQLIEMIEDRISLTSILKNNTDNPNKLDESDKEFFQFKSIKYSFFILPILIVSFILFDFNLGKYGDLVFWGSFFFIVFLIYEFLKRKNT